MRNDEMLLQLDAKLLTLQMLNLGLISLIEIECRENYKMFD